MARSQIEYVAIGALRPWSKNARTHSRKQIRQIADSIERFGFTNPVLIDRANSILAGHGRVAAGRCCQFNADWSPKLARIASGAGV